MEVQEEFPQNFNHNSFPAANPSEAMTTTEGRTPMLESHPDNKVLLQEQVPVIDQNDTRNETNNQIEPMEEVYEAQEAQEAEDQGSTSDGRKTCNYCNQTYREDVLLMHLEYCDFRRIPCDKCEQRVIIEIYDAHYNECNPDRDDGGSDIEGQEGNMEEEGNGENEGRQQQQTRPRQNTPSMYLPESSLTYEQLLLLDETIVKKGLTQEQLKKFRVRVYVKSLDGEGFCNICMSSYNTGEYTKELNCRHKFHDCCVDQWLGTNITCPTCKKYLR